MNTGGDRCLLKVGSLLIGVIDCRDLERILRRAAWRLRFRRGVLLAMALLWGVVKAVLMAGIFFVFGLMLLQVYGVMLGDLGRVLMDYPWPIAIVFFFLLLFRIRWNLPMAHDWVAVSLVLAHYSQRVSDGVKWDRVVDIAPMVDGPLRV